MSLDLNVLTYPEKEVVGRRNCECVSAGPLLTYIQEHVSQFEVIHDIVHLAEWAKYVVLSPFVTVLGSLVIYKSALLLTVGIVKEAFVPELSLLVNT